MTTAAATEKIYRHLQRQRDSRGSVRLYWRHAHLPKPVKCFSAEGSPEFDAQYEQLNAELAAWSADRSAQAASKPKAPTKVIGFLPGTVGSVIDQFEGSKRFERLRPGTQNAYRSAGKLMKSMIGGGVLTQLDEFNVRSYLNKVENNNGPARRHMQQVLLSVLWKFSKSLTECKHKGRVNPAREIEREYRVAKPHAPWPEDIQERFLDGAPDYLRHAFFLLLYTGQRRSDVVRMKKSHFNPATLRLLVEKQVKTGARVPLKVHKRLLPVLREMLVSSSDHLLLADSGEPWAGYGNGLTHAFRRRLQAVGVGPKQYTLHGLRKSAACAIAEARATVPQMMAIFGWTNPEQAMYYIRESDKSQLVSDGMDLWEQADDRKLRLVKSA